MLDGKKTAGNGQAHSLLMRLAGRALFVLCLMFVPTLAAAGTFSSNSARDGGTEIYHENGSFGTNRGSASSFTVDPESGDKSFETRPLPEKTQAEQIEIMPLYPEVRPQVPSPRPPLVVNQPK